MSVICVSRCGVTRGTLSGEHVLTLIWKIMTGGLFKIILNWAVLTPGRGKSPVAAALASVAKIDLAARSRGYDETARRLVVCCRCGRYVASKPLGHPSYTLPPPE